MRAIDLTGQRFGRVVALARSAWGSAQRDIRWVCACDCGELTTISSRELRAKSRGTRSCGCLQVESRRICRVVCLTGHTYARLTVLGPAERKTGGRLMWRCRCECGREVSISGANLRNGHTRSCGCLALEVRTTHGLSGTPEFRKMHKALRRSRARAAGGSFTAEQVRDLYVRQRGRCTYCGRRKALARMEADHVVPLALGGSSEIGNIQLLCMHCNRTKGHRHPLEFARSLGLLV